MIFRPHPRELVLYATPPSENLKPRLTPLECAVPRIHALSPLECAVTKTRSCNSFRMRSYEKRWGGCLPSFCIVARGGIRPAHTCQRQKGKRGRRQRTALQDNRGRRSRAEVGSTKCRKKRCFLSLGFGGFFGSCLFSRGLLRRGNLWQA